MTIINFASVKRWNTSGDVDDDETRFSSLSIFSRNELSNFKPKTNMKYNSYWRCFDSLNALFSRTHGY